MEIESQVCSLEYAKKLKELGIKQENLYAYVNSEFGIINGKSYENKIMLTHEKVGNSPNKWAAFTSDELLDLLPAFIDIKQNEPFNFFNLQITKQSAENIKYIGNYICDSVPGEEAGNPLFQISCEAKSHSSKLADCLAQMLIYLIENGLYKNPKE